MSKRPKQSLTDLLKDREGILAPLSYGNLLIGVFEQETFRGPVVLMLFDMRKFVIKKITHNCEGIWGWTKKELEGKNISSMIHPNDLDDSIALANKGLLETAPVINYKNRHFDNKGNVVYLLWQASATINLECLCVALRITESQYYQKS